MKPQGVLNPLPLLIGLALVLGAFTATPTSGVERPAPPCGTRLPITLHVGLPDRIAPRADPSTLRSVVERATEPLARAVARQAPPCIGQRRYEIILSVGSDYEILDWLSQGKVDAGLVSSLGSWLLERDHVELFDFSPDPASVSKPDPHVAAVLRAPDGSGTAISRPDQALNAYREQLLCRAIGALGASGTDRSDTVWQLCPINDHANGVDHARDDRSEASTCPNPLPHVQRYQPVAPDHLSEAGFVFPLLSNRLWLAEQLNNPLGDSLDASLHSALERRIDDAMLCDLRLTLDHDPFDRLEGLHAPLPLPGSKAATGDAAHRPTAVTEILFASASPRHGTTITLPPTPGIPGHDRWVLLASRAATLLGEVDESRSRLGKTQWPQRERVRDQYNALFRIRQPAVKTAEDQLAPHRPSPALATLLDVHRGFGTRTMAFTADEVVRLLRARQRQAVRAPHLALVLPGGGVKSTYQSVLLDRLYGSGRLRNAYPRPETPGSHASATEALDSTDSQAVDVHQVIGTSGGALIGYFVAQLDRDGPFNLTEILWRRPTDPDQPGRASTFLRSKDIFGWTDILRYASLIVSFAVLALLLVSLGPRMSRRLAQARGHDGDPNSEAERPRSRAWLYLTLGGLMALTPVLVASLSATRFQEHIPEIEGLLFMVLTFLVMAADQCLVRTTTAVETPDPAITDARDGRTLIARLAMSIGGLMMLLPIGTAILARSLAGADPPDGQVSGTELDLYALLLGDHASVAFCFVVLSLPTVFVAVALPVRVTQAPRWAAKGPFVAFMDYLACAAVALSVLWLPDLRWGAKSVPILFWGLTAPALLWWLHGTLRRGRDGFGRWRWRSTYYGGLTVACAALVALCSSTRPDPTGVRGPFEITSRLATLGGSLLITAGAVTVAYGLLLWFSRAEHGYRIRHLPRFAAGLAIVIGHAAFAQAAVLLFSMVRADSVPTLELDGRFWFWLLAFALLGGMTLLAAVRYGRHKTRPNLDTATGPRAWTDRICRHAFEGVTFLVEPHPNGPARCWRIFAICLFSIGWWNLLLAPALYGNRLARETLDRAVATFDRVRARQGGPTLTPPSNHDLPYFTATFVAPANELAADGTRFFLFRPAASPLPAIPEHSRSGSRWLCHRMDRNGVTESPGDPCPRIPTRSLLLDVIFASGSPFPIFAPHRVGAPLDGKSDMVLIDGGYSNVVPVEAAHTLGSEHVLVLRSSAHPVASDPQRGLLARLSDRWLSPLFKNLGRLPAFVFERSQRVDRLSGQDLFVVSLAPAKRHRKWPALYHFQSAVIQRLEGLANADLEERIGFVESWGQPHPVVSVPMPLTDSTSVRATTPPDPPTPAPVRFR